MKILTRETRLDSRVGLIQSEPQQRSLTRITVLEQSVEAENQSLSVSERHLRLNHHLRDIRQVAHGQSHPAADTLGDAHTHRVQELRFKRPLSVAVTGFIGIRDVEKQPCFHLLEGNHQGFLLAGIHLGPDAAFEPFQMSANLSKLIARHGFEDQLCGQSLRAKHFGGLHGAVRAADFH